MRCVASTSAAASLHRRTHAGATAAASAPTAHEWRADLARLATGEKVYLDTYSPSPSLEVAAPRRCDLHGSAMHCLLTICLTHLSELEPWVSSFRSYHWMRFIRRARRSRSLSDNAASVGCRTMLLAGARASGCIAICPTPWVATC